MVKRRMVLLASSLHSIMALSHGAIKLRFGRPP